MERPSIHFAPESNWMNDPNGTVYKDGVYHLFYQYNPYGSDWGNIQWAYATSSDLMDWERKGLKLSPDSSISEKYCFSGCSVRMPEGFKCFYTSIGYEDDAVQHHAKQLICDADENFNKIHRNGYAITKDIHDFSVSEWRDPFVFRFGGKSFMVLAGIGNGKSCVFLYEAKDRDLNKWEYIAPLYEIDQETDMIECPNVAVFGTRIVLMYSLVRENIVRYISGEFDGRQIRIGVEGVVDYGVNCFYATNIAYGANGETVLFAWEKESLIGASSPDGKYSGCLAIPRILRLNGYRLEIYFINSLMSLYKHRLPVTEGAFPVVYGDQERTMMTFVTESDSEMAILKNSDEEVRLVFRDENLRISRKCLLSNADNREIVAQVGGGKKEVQIVCDGTIVEILVSNQTSVCFRHYRQKKIDILFQLIRGYIERIHVCELNEANIK